MNPDLRRQAEALGVETSFVGADGIEREAEEPTLRLLLDMLGTASADEDAGAGKIVPSPAYLPQFVRDGRQSWVLNVQLYSLCNARNRGHGDFTDLRQLLELVADAGGGGVGVNPLHALNEAEPDRPSPYAPSSRIFLNWLYIDVAELPGIAPDRLASLCGPAAPAGATIDYPAVAAGRERVLRASWRHFSDHAGATERRGFEEFRREMGEDLRRYAAFCLLRRREGGAWRYWRRPWAQPTPADIDTLAHEEADEIGYHEFVQFQAHRQLAACRAYAERRALDIGLYLDLAVGVDPDGFDSWNDSEAFLQGVSIGAPPDPMNWSGQNWGLTAFHPGVLKRTHFAAFRKMLRAAMRHAGAVRIDHILGLNRLFVIPPDRTAAAGAYVRFPFAELLAVTAQESRTHRCLVIGEDLGTVPEGLRDQLRAYGIWTFCALIFERDENGFRPATDYPEFALATFSTHDLPTFAGWREGRDLALLQSLDLPTAESAEERRASVAKLRRALLSETGSNAGTDLDFEAVIEFLFRTPCRLLSFALEDVLRLETQVNLPGTDREYPNWRHPVAFEIERVRQTLQPLVRSGTPTDRGGRRNDKTQATKAP